MGAGRVEAFVQHEYDGLRRLQVRAVAGLGPKLDLLRSEHAALGLGVAYMIEYERLSNDSMLVDAGAKDITHRVSSYLVGHYEFDPRLHVVETVYAQPRIVAPSDIRILSEASLRFALTERLAYATSFVIAYDSRPPETIERLDTALKATLTLKL